MNAALAINALFTKPDLVVGDPNGFEQVRSAIREQFGVARVRDFLASLDGRKVRIRDFEAVLSKGLLGKASVDTYNDLGNGDQGQIREFYLASLEQVSPELRRKFLKLYSYY